MEIAHNKQTWKGFFTYYEGYEPFKKCIQVDFDMQISFDEDSFTGICSDSESKHIFEKPADVKGFIDEEKISFIKNYPCLYYKDEDGKIMLDRELKHPEIHYLGYFNENKRNISGTWEMVVYERKHLDYYLEEVISGEFEMKRI